MAIDSTLAHVVLEPASQAFVEATATPPFLYELTPDEARKVLDDVQAAPIDKLPVDERWITVPADVGDVQVRIVRPAGAEGTLPVILYMHGGGWVLGNAGTHDRLVRELACGAGAALVFVEYDRSPEARYPVAIEQGYATARWIVREGAAARARPGADGDRRRLGRRRHDRRDHAHGAGARRRALRPPVHVLPGHRRGDGHRLLRAVRGGLLPHRQGDGVVLGLLLPGRSSGAPSRSPRRCGPRDSQLAGLPPALLIVDEADVLRDEGEAYASRLREAGVAVTTVRYDGITHDFMMLNPLSETRATRAAVAQAIATLRQALHAG